MVRNLIKKIREKINKLTRSSAEIKPQTWEERKKELLSNVRSGKRKEPPSNVKSGERKESHSNIKSGERKESFSKVKPGEKKELKEETKTVSGDKPVYEKKSPPQKIENKNRPPFRDKKQIEIKSSKIEKWEASNFTVEPAAGKKRFHDFNLPEEIMRAIYDLKFEYCTPIQAEILEKTFAGKDAAGQAQTGTGKTAAFLITIFTRLLRNPVKTQKRGTPRALIIAPTRELVIQITSDAKDLSKHTSLNIVSLFGGLDYRKQKNQLLTQNIDVIVATPGRLLDFYSKKDIDLREVETLVLDEADRMMDMGFIPDVRKIVRATPHKDSRQTMLFSATLPSEILRLASSWMKDPEIIDIEPEQVAADNIEQIIYLTTTHEKITLLYNIITRQNAKRVIVFVNRRDEARKLESYLSRLGINTAVLSGDVEQRKRLSTLTNFKEGKIKVLVATDVAGRGIHVEGVSHVINFNLPEDPEDYVHRIGRTGRAGAEGISISFACEDDSFQLPAIEKFLGKKLSFIYPDEELLKPMQKQ